MPARNFRSGCARSRPDCLSATRLRCVFRMARFTPRERRRAFHFPRRFVKRRIARRIALFAQGYYRTPEIHYDAATLRGRPFHYFVYGAAVSEVEMDGFTGDSRLLRVDILEDAGTSLSPIVDRGQIEGGFIQGAGWMTIEELLWDAQGRVATAGASTYKLPSWSEVPPVFQRRLSGTRRRAGRGFREQSCGRAAADAGHFGAPSDSRCGGRFRQRRGRWLGGSGDSGAHLLCHPARAAQGERWQNQRSRCVHEFLRPRGIAAGSACFTRRAIHFVNEQRSGILRGRRAADARRQNGCVRRLRRNSRRSSGRPDHAICAADFCCRGSSTRTFIFRSSRAGRAWVRQLLDWLEYVALPEEARMAEPAYACETAQAISWARWLRMEPRRRWCSAHISQGPRHRCSRRPRDPVCASSVEWCFPIAGCVRNCISFPRMRIASRTDLIRRFHGKGRLLYAVTPRFALSASEAMLEVCQTLLRENPGRSLSNSLEREPAGDGGSGATVSLGHAIILNVYERFRTRRGAASVMAHNVHPTRFRIGAAGCERHGDFTLPVQ